MPVSRGEDPNLDHLMRLMGHDQLSAVIVGHLVIESLLVKFLEMQQGADIDKILAFNFPMKVERCVAGGLIRSELGVFLKVLNRQRNNFAHRLGHRISFEDAFWFVRRRLRASISLTKKFTPASRLRAIVMAPNSSSSKSSRTLHRKLGSR